jgi:hypothetical protein
MKVRPHASAIVADIADVVPPALEVASQYRGHLRRLAEEHYDWVPVARRLRQLLEEIAAGASGAPAAGASGAPAAGAARVSGEPPVRR